MERLALIISIFFSLVVKGNPLANAPNISNDTILNASLAKNKITLSFNQNKISIEVKKEKIKIKHHENENKLKSLSLKITEGDQLQLSFFGNNYVVSIMEFSKDEFLAVLKCEPTSCSGQLILYRLAFSKKTKKAGVEYELDGNKSFLVL